MYSSHDHLVSFLLPLDQDLDLVLWSKKAVGCFKSCLMGHPSNCTKDRGTENDFKCWGMSHRIQRRILECLEITLLIFL